MLSHQMRKLDIKLTLKNKLIKGMSILLIGLVIFCSYLFLRTCMIACVRA